MSDLLWEPAFRARRGVAESEVLDRDGNHVCTCACYLHEFPGDTLDVWCDGDTAYGRAVVIAAALNRAAERPSAIRTLTHMDEPLDIEASKDAHDEDTS